MPVESTAKKLERIERKLDMLIGLHGASVCTPQPPAGGPKDIHFANVASLLHFDGNLTDVKGKTWTANGNASATGVAQVGFGTNSLTLDGNGDFLVTPHHDDFNFGSGDFTIEGWVNYSSANYDTVVGKWMNSGTKSWILLGPGVGNDCYFYFNNDSGWRGFTWVRALNTWQHFALSRNGNNLRLFINGVQSGVTADMTGVTINDSAESVRIGSHSGASFFNGMIDDLRITKGVGRYTANFTPPTAAFPNS